MAEEKSKLVDLKRSKAEKKERQESIKAMPAGEDYSYGTRLHLGEDELSKMGHDDNPEVGTEHHFFGKGRVTQSSHDQDESGDPRRSVTIQITHLSPLKQSGSDTKPEKTVRDDIKDSVRSSEEKTGKAETKSSKNDDNGKAK